ncbi:MAG: M15 family metallopeptidase [Rufibacter sp.]
MKKLLFLCLFCIGVAETSLAQLAKLPTVPKNPYGLEIVNTMQLYRQQVAANPNHELVELKKHIPGLVLDIKYATKDNLVGEPVYKTAAAFARKPVAEALKKVQADLKPLGVGLKIYDGYRPYQVTVHFFNKVKEKDFVANPKDGSRHNRGCAIDLTLIDLKTGKELEMPTAYDATVAKAAPDYPNVSEQVKKNRALLIDAMERHGFKVLRNEWWHFDFKDWRNFPLMDIPFEELRAVKKK